MRQGGDLVYSRDRALAELHTKSQMTISQPLARLQDFQILRMIGKGTFGKVYLVQNQLDKEIYAMKCIRKDIIIDNE